MGFFKKKKAKAEAEKDRNESGKKRKPFDDDFNWKENAKRITSANAKKTSKVRERDNTVRGSPASGKGQTTDNVASVSKEERQIQHMGALFNLAHKHVGDASYDPLQKMTHALASASIGTPPDAIPFGSRFDGQVPRKICISNMPFDVQSQDEKDSEGSSFGRTEPTTGCSVFDLLSQYREAFCSPVHSGIEPYPEIHAPLEEVLVTDASEMGPVSIPREISFSKVEEQPIPTGYQVLGEMEELSKKRPPLFERLDLRKRNDKVLPKLKVYVDKPKPPKHSSGTSVFSALTDPSGLEHKRR